MWRVQEEFFENFLQGSPYEVSTFLKVIYHIATYESLNEQMNLWKLIFQERSWT